MIIIRQGLAIVRMHSRDLFTRRMKLADNQLRLADIDVQQLFQFRKRLLRFTDALCAREGGVG